MSFRLILAGDRRLSDYAFVADYLDRCLANRLPDVVILSGGAPGADALGERYAEDQGLTCERFPADWAAHGRGAGPKRNRQMARSPGVNACVIFDGGGPGSRSMASEARAAGLVLRVVDVRHLLP